MYIRQVYPINPIAAIRMSGIPGVPLAFTMFTNFTGNLYTTAQLKVLLLYHHGKPKKLKETKSSEVRRSFCS